MSDVLRTDDIIERHGLASVWFGLLTRSFFKGGKRMGCSFVEADPLGGIFATALHCSRKVQVDSQQRAGRVGVDIDKVLMLVGKSEDLSGDALTDIWLALLHRFGRK